MPILTRMRLLASALLFLSASLPAQRILHYAELNTTQIQQLDRAHTVLVLTNGILEEHGPYLPSGTDGYWQEALAASLTRSLAARPGWTVVTFPVLPIGTSPANVIAGRFSFPGSVTVRAATMRGLFLDLADALGEQGFRHIFIVDAHGGPMNSVALDQAGDYFHDTYGGRMVHLYGLMPVVDCCRTLENTLTPQQVKENGMSVHADAMEMSEALYASPQFVSPAYKQAPIRAGADFAGLVAQATKPDWPGYLGAPAYGSAELGKRYFNEMTAFANRTANDILDGKVDPATLPRYGAVLVSQTESIEQATVAHEAQQAAKQSAWLAQHTTLIDRPATPAH